VSVVQRSYRELPCKRCGQPIAIGDRTPSPALEALADFESTGPAKAVPASSRPTPSLAPLAPHPSILAAMASASPFATATAPPDGWPDTATSPPKPPAMPPELDPDTIVCPTCGAYYARSLAVCPLCEAPPDRPLVTDPRCPSCSGPIALADRHCRHCGGVLQPAGARGGSWRWLALAGAIAVAAAIGFWAVRFLLGR
jgi:hypothetical protein